MILILSIISFFIILGVVVFIHEFGHFIAAKKLGVRVEEFGLGFPPAIWKKKKGETVYSINIIPLGGFNKLYGEEDTDRSKSKDPKSFSSKSPLKRAIIVFGGVAMNFLLAVVIFYFLLGFNNFQFQTQLIFDYKFPFGNQENFPPLISYIAKDSPAEKMGLELNDMVIKGNDVNFKSSGELIDFINKNKGEEINLTVKKYSDSQIKEIKIIPRVAPPEGEGSLGIALADLTEIKYDGFFNKITSGFLHSFNFIHYSLFGLNYFVKTSLAERNIEPIASSVAGPVGILVLTKATIQLGIQQVFLLIAIISLALAIFNILPIPALDGGRLVFLFFESIRGKPMNPKLEQKIINVSFMVLIGILVLVTIKDVIKLF